jgi:ketosteroid isomerase-like protein
MGAQENLETSKRGYGAFGRGDAEGALDTIADDVEWIVPGESAISGTYHGKQEVAEFWGKLAEKNFETHPEHWLAEGDMVVVLTHWKMDGGEADAADVATYRDGKVVKFQSAGDTALFERVFGK